MESLGFWKGALSEVYNDLSVGQAAGVKVQVAGESESCFMHTNVDVLVSQYMGSMSGLGHEN